MNTIYTDNKLREALYSVYVAQCHVLKNCKEHFKGNHATQMLTSLMGSRPWSWRVIGITPSALEIFAQHDFQKPPRLVQRGHVKSRHEIAQELCMGESCPLPLPEFFEKFLRYDETVLMTVSENPARARVSSPDFIKIERARELFPCGSLIGWKHRNEEIAFLRDLYKEHGKQKL